MYHNGDRKLILIIDLFIAQGHKNSRKKEKKMKYVVKVLVFIGSNFHGFYKIH